MFARLTAGGLVRVAAFVAVMHGFSVVARADYGGGSGTGTNPYLIFTAEQLDAIGAQPGDWDKHFKLMADIDLSGYRGTTFHRIGTPDDGPFTGTFDGNYKTISNFQWVSDWMRYVGLFGFVDGEQVRISNLTLVDSTVATESGQYAAVLAGFVRDATISNCHVRRGTVSGDTGVGALIGKKEGGKVIDCTAQATVHGASRVGGLIGFSYWGLIEHCDAVCEVTGCTELECWAVGGLVGENQNGLMTNCHARCTVRGSRGVGGLIGQNATASIRRSWTDGIVSGEQDIGGMIGRNSGGEISDSYSLTDVSGVVFVGGLAGYHGPSCDCTTAKAGVIERCYAAGGVSSVSAPGGLSPVNDRSRITDSFWDTQSTGCKISAGGTAGTTRQMQTLSTYINAGWDFVGEDRNGTEDIWCPPASGDYPRLAWQIVIGDLDGNGNVDFRDFAILARQWRQTDNGFWSSGAFALADGMIDFDDFDVLTRAWLTGDTQPAPHRQ